MSIDLKLAEYNLETEKFERFLELPQFGYFGKMIALYPRTLIQALARSTIFSLDQFYKYDLDKTDPLNRFNGLFDGRTYGNGRFVLIEDNEDDILECVSIIKNPELIASPLSEMVIYTREKYDKMKHGVMDYLERSGALENKYKQAGNLPQNPELWEKVK